MVKNMTQEEIREYIEEFYPEEEILIYENPSYCTAFLGIANNRAVYSYDKMIEYLIKEDNMAEEEAIEFIDYNTIRASEYYQNAPLILNECELIDKGEISDGYHTFNSLYEQRMILSAALAKNNPNAWKSKLHSDGTKPFDGTWFIMGWHTPEGEYTYHYELKYWDLFDCKELEKAPEWDGHTDEDIRRLLSLE